MRVMRLCERPVFLFNMSFESMLDKPSAFFPTNCFRLVSRKRIDHHNFIGDRLYRIDTAANVTGFVEGDDDDG